MMSLKYYKKALEDIEEIFIYIFQDKPDTAKQYIKNLRKRIEILHFFPNLGQDCKTKMINKKCKVLALDNFLIFYKVNGDVVTIQRVLNQKQNYKGSI